MVLTETQLAEAISSSKLGRYNIVKMAVEWIALNKQNDSFKRLTQIEIINKALNDVVTNVATPEKIEELYKKMKTAGDKVKH
ncbi:MAG: hypothetical protein LBL71_04605 [Endomicrobium sp.]|jgi:hypothetical protein|nr:hypothetical protein [Endomicrobium sp.]